jgi:restriction system protein
MEISERKYILVRSKIDPDTSSVVGIGYGDVPFNKYSSADEIISEINKLYPVGRRANQIRRFKGIRKGDVIVVPLYRSIALGIAEDKEIYAPECGLKDSDNQREVRFLRSKESNTVIRIPRIDLPTDLQTRLKIQIAVADLGQFSKQFDRLLDKPGVSPWDNAYLEACSDEENDFTKRLTTNLRKQKTRLAASGSGLEQLVKELLQVSGYANADVLSKRHFPGDADADISASNRFSKILIQVKHHDGDSGPWGIEQLKKIAQFCPDDYADYQLVFLTSGAVDEKVRNEAVSVGFIVIDGDALAEWVLASLPRLSEKTKMMLGISEVPHFVNCSD